MANLPFLIRRYVPGDEVAITDLVNRVFGAAFQDYVPRGVAWWRWKYGANPCGHDTLVAEDGEGRLVGHYAGSLLEVRAEGRSFTFAQSCDTCVDATARRGLKNPGLFVRMAQAYESTFAGAGRAAVMYGLPIPGPYRVGAKFMDYWMLRVQVALVYRGPGRSLALDPSVEIERAESFPEDIDELPRLLAPAHPCIGRRDAVWLNWRFPPGPGDPYRRAVVRDARSGAVRGYAVYRRGFFLVRDLGILMDWMADPADVAACAAIHSFVCGEAADAGLREVVLLASPAGTWFGRFLDAGWRVEPTDYVMVGRPFHPDLEPVYLRTQWHYTLADLDVI